MCVWSISGCAIDLFKNLWYCVPFSGHCQWQLVAKSNKMFNKPHVLSFLALPLYPCGCEPETDPRPPPEVQCNFACVLCVHVCSQFHIFLSCSRVSWRNVLSWTEQLGTEFWKGKKNQNSLGYFLWKVKMFLYSGAILPGRKKVSCPGEWKPQMWVSQPKLVRKRGQLAVPLDIYLICGVAIGFWMLAAIIKVRYCCYALKQKERKIKPKQFHNSLSESTPTQVTRAHSCGSGRMIENQGGYHALS